MNLKNLSDKTLLELYKEEKATQSTNNPLIPKENEKMDDDKLAKSLKEVLKTNEQTINLYLEQQIGNAKLKEVKSVDDLLAKLKDLIGISAVKSLSDRVISDQFFKGWEIAEKQLGRNFVPNESAVKYLKDHTFSNIKDMSDEIGNDLRAELQRGIINGEGVAKLKERVKSVFDKADTRAEAIARTEVNRAENVGTMQAMKASGEKILKTWDATLDNRTSEICNRLNGQTKGLNEPFVDPKTGNEYMSPPSHVNCRSVLTYSMEEKDGE